MLTVRWGTEELETALIIIGPVLDDPALFVLLAHHVPGGVLEEEERDVDLVGQLDELGGLVGLLGEEHAPVVGQDADRVAVDGGPAGDQTGSVERLELVEARAVDHPGQHLAGVEGDLGVGRGDAEQFVGVVDRRSSAGMARAGPVLPPVEAAHDLAAEPDGVDLVGGQVVGQAGHPGVHGGAAQLLVVGLLAGGHLDQGRAAQEDLGPLLDHHDVVAHARARRRRRRWSCRRPGPRWGAPAAELPGQVAEGPTPGDEQLGLGGKVGPSRLDQVDDGQPVLQGDVRGAGPLAEGERVHGPTPHGGVVGRDQALDPLDHADPDDGGCAHRVLGAPRGQGASSRKARVPVEQQLDALAGQELPPLPVALHVALATARPGLGQLLVDRRPGPRPEGALGWPGRCPSSGRRWMVRTGMGSGSRGAGSHSTRRRGKNRPHDLTAA